MAFRSIAGMGRALRAAILCMGAAAAVLIATADPAEAARRKKRGGGYSPPYAAMVIDVKSGRTLHAVNEDALRHPASVTKVMTLYLMFEQIERGRFTMDTPLRVSSEAARQSPSKLYLETGETISVRDAVMALITKSANDAAVVVAEAIGGDEDRFAQMMTAKARALGMSRTVFRNASGLPNPQQVTTARDLTILARAIQERFPRQYALFQTRSFEYAGDRYANHNKLLGRIEGVDGIKTGFTRASGFNLMTSAKSDGRHIVAIVLGGRSGRARDAIMGNLVVANLPRAIAGPRTTSLIAEAPAEPVRARPAVVAEAPRPVTPEPQRARQEQSRPDQVRIEQVVARQDNARQEPSSQAASSQVMAFAAPMPPQRVATRQAPLDLSATRPVAASATTPSALRWAAAPQGQQVGGQIIRPSREPVLRPPANVDVTSSIARAAEPAPEIRQEARQESRQVAKAEPTPEPKAEAKIAHRIEPRQAELRNGASAHGKTEAKAEAKADARAESARSTSGWVIQLAATDDEGKAREILSRARSRASGALGDASAFTEKVAKGGATLFRARFAGFDDAREADAACKAIKRGGFSCFAVKG
jgi:D-alanyl-D-alanine carboxypeptidase